MNIFEGQPPALPEQIQALNYPLGKEFFTGRVIETAEIIDGVGVFHLDDGFTVEATITGPVDFQRVSSVSALDDEITEFYGEFISPPPKEPNDPIPELHYCLVSENTRFLVVSFLSDASLTLSLKNGENIEDSASISLSGTRYYF